MAEKDWDLVKALVIGGLIGAGLGILFAPKSGKETREDIARKTDELLARVGEEFEKEDGRGRLAFEGAIDRVKQAEEKAVEKITDLAKRPIGRKKIKTKCDVPIEIRRREGWTRFRDRARAGFRWLAGGRESLSRSAGRALQVSVFV